MTSLREDTLLWPNTNKSIVYAKLYRNFEKQIKNKNND